MTGAKGKTGRPAGLRPVLEPILEAAPPRAAAFIVTLYGDVVVPRGGELWIGNVIETCAGIGINESRVRTAVSRLVGAGRLRGVRAGRRGYYRLTPSAEAEFADAANVLFAPPDPGDGKRWRFVWLAGEGAPEALETLERAGFGRLSARLAVVPSRRGTTASETMASGAAGALAFEAEAPVGTDPAALRDFASTCWPLAEHARAYERFIAMFAPLETALGTLAAPDAGECLLGRLLLVHAYRAVALAEPRLPHAALPADWPGHPARKLYARLYQSLSPGADAHIAQEFVDTRGRLADRGGALAARQAALASHR